MLMSVRILLVLLCLALPTAGFADNMVGHLSSCGGGASGSDSHASHIFGFLGRSFDSRPVHLVGPRGEDIFSKISAQCVESFPGSGEVMRAGLSPNLPNPFRTETEIGFVLKAGGRVLVRIYDVSGRRVRTLLEGIRAPNERHRLTWDGKNDAGEPVANGLYFCQLVTPEFSETRKIVFLR